MTQSMNEENDNIIVGNQTIPVQVKMLNQANLSFYPQNPRVYNVLNSNDKEPTQQEIEKYMCESEHVKQLKLSIESNGGLIDPLIVKDGDFVVLEGNSRLAAYRLLASKDPAKWGFVKCKILPANISEDIIFKLLGQYHIIGRKDWDPFEQAHYLYRRMQKTTQNINSIASELGISTSKAKRMVEIITFMKEHDDLNKRHWSYYDEYFKNSGLKKYRETSNDIDNVIAEQIKDDKINQASDIRKIGQIAGLQDKQSKRIMKEIISEEISIYDGYEQIEESGKLDSAYKKLNKFHMTIADKKFQNQLKSIAIECKSKNDNKVKYELTRTIQKLNQIKKDIDKIYGTKQ